MDIERETLVEIAVSVAAVGLFIAAVVVVGATDGAGFTSTGALELVAVVFGFVLLMTGVGVFLDRR
ncbi:transporter [Halosegnis sp.]|uniref:DUF7472 family protein n=1 Tax=Halosegnis sp. TaxID=2864959 RepID=UPI0035D3ED6D